MNPTLQYLPGERDALLATLLEFEPTVRLGSQSSGRFHVPPDILRAAETSEWSPFDAEADDVLYWGEEI